MITIGRWLGALAVTLVLSVDDYETEESMITKDDQGQAESGPANEADGPLGDLLTSVRRAASELQDGGERDNRIALQLLNAMAQFHKKAGAP